MKQYHSRSYHRYFEGYTEKEIVNEKGKQEIVRVYTGNYYTAELPEKERRRSRRMTVFLFIAATALYLCVGVLRTQVNLLMPVAALEGILLFLLLFLGRSVFYQMAEKMPYTVRKYKLASEQLLTFSKAAAVCCWLTALVMAAAFLWYTAAGEMPDVSLSFCCIVGFVLCGLLLYRIYHIESRTTWHVEKSTAKRPEKGADIQY